MAQETKGSGTNVLLIIAAALIAFVGGYVVGDNTGSSDNAETSVTADTGAAALGNAAPAGDSDLIPVGTSYVKGNANAPITIVEFSEFQCPYCTRGGKTMDEIVKKFPNDVKVVFKHNPLAFHKQAPAMSKAALAAGEQGKFFEMHDKIFAAQKEFKGKTDDQVRDFTAEMAKQLGLDAAKFKKDFGNPKYDQIIKDDLALGVKLAVRGTPHFFVNGERVKGAQPAAKFEEIIKRQLADAKKQLAAGVKKDALYATMVKKNYKATAPADAKKPGKPQGQVVNFVPVTDADPVKGSKDPLVTIVEFSDFQCPFCSKVNPTIDQVMKNFGKDVRVVFKQNALPFHKEAPAAAEASLAANEQGKFWEMHDVLFENYKNFKGANMTELTTGYAQQIGLNVNKFKAALESGKYKQKVKDDMALAAKVGARGTPNFFVNGVQLVGAKPYPAFEAEIKKQIGIAKKIKADKGLKGEALYKAVADFNKKNAPKAPAAAAAPPKPPEKVDVSKLKIGKSFVKGPKNAKVTIFEFSDFECPYCSRGNNSVMAVAKMYPKDVKVVFKAFPLPFHKKAEPAHRAALAAGQQGKFWEMHDKIFANVAAFKADDGVYEKWAGELGLNVAKFNTDFASDAMKQQVQSEMAEGKTVGVRGTPAFFINGNRLVGAQPVDKFKELVEAELKK